MQRADPVLTPRMDIYDIVGQRLDEVPNKGGMLLSERASPVSWKSAVEIDAVKEVSPRPCLVSQYVDHWRKKERSFHVVCRHFSPQNVDCSGPSLFCAVDTPLNPNDGPGNAAMYHH